MKTGFVIFGSFLFALTSMSGVAADAAQTEGADAVAMTNANMGEGRFSLDVGKATGKAGEKATAKIKITPADGYHMNADFPTSLSLEAPADVELAKAKLKKGDLKGFDEHKGGSFDVVATAKKAGNYTIKGKLKFAICNESSCSPVTEKVSIVVAAK